MRPIPTLLKIDKTQEFYYKASNELGFDNLDDWLRTEVESSIKHT